jgi:hypothetical protein
MYGKPYPTTTLSTKYLTWIDTGLNLVLHNERMQTKLLQNTWKFSDNSVTYTMSVEHCHCKSITHKSEVHLNNI